MKNRYLINMLDPESWLVVDHKMNPTSDFEFEEQHVITWPEGPHIMFEFTDSTFFPGADSKHHAHQNGYETFFIGPGSLDVTIQGKTCHVNAGDIIFIPPTLSHRMQWGEETVWRGIFHDLDMNGGAKDSNFVNEKSPELLKDPDFMSFYNANHDFIVREMIPPEGERVDEMQWVRRYDKPLTVYNFDGLTFKQYTGRWENNGIMEVWLAEMEKGFGVEWTAYNANLNFFYVTKGEVEFNVGGEVFTATHDCLVKIPPYVATSFVCMSDASMYDIGGLTHWNELIEDINIYKLNSENGCICDKKMAELKAKYRCYISKCSKA